MLAFTNLANRVAKPTRADTVVEGGDSSLARSNRRTNHEPDAHSYPIEYPIND